MKIGDNKEDKPIRLLLVDDEDHFRQTLAKRLAKKGMAPEQAANGDACLSILETTSIDVVVLDVKMPGMDGIEVLRKITDLYPKTEVILLTGQATTLDGIEGIKCGAFDYLMKPIELDHLYTKIIQAHDKIKRSQDEQKESEYRKQMEQQMIATERLASLGTLAAGVAHEINNPLAIIRESTGWIRQLFTKSELKDLSCQKDFVNVLDILDNSVERASRITHQLLGFVRNFDSTVSEVYLAELAEEAIRLVTPEVKNREINIVRQVEPSRIGPIRSDPYPLRQVILNLLTNAIHAIASAGTITIDIKDFGDNQVITIRDTGHGIPRENLAKIFEPFFTTKPTGEGTGLGLFVTQGIIEQLGGTIRVESQVGSGTSFSIRLPKQPRKKSAMKDGFSQNWVKTIKSRFAE